jgi:LysR family glycine cleavage system transcriptional activator
MCSPRLLQGKRQPQSVDDLLKYRLIYSRNRPDDWQGWVSAVGRPDFPLDQADMIELPNSMLANQAAADGVGIVIGEVPLLGTEFASQPLIPLFDEPVRQGSYYAVWRAGTEPSRKARQFLSWLQRQLEPLVAEPPPPPPAPMRRPPSAPVRRKPASRPARVRG